jgi:3-hydroxyacyl-[acyl-carrier-protein] dehydratase
VISNHDSTPDEDPALREALKRCSPTTYIAACNFRRSGSSDELRTVILGVIERFVERELRPKLLTACDSLRLTEDLAIDSLTMMEIVMIAEEVLHISVSNEELTPLRTLGDVHRFMLAKATQTTTPGPTSQFAIDHTAWTLTAMGEKVQRIDDADDSITRVPT